MRIGYCSPFSPLKSGISDFSKELVCVLGPLMDVVLFSPSEIDDVALCQQFETHLLKELHDQALRDSLDLIIYHIGNNVMFHGEIVEMLRKYPGVAEIHEVGLHNLAAAMTLEAQGKEAYLSMVEYCHGTRGVAIAEAFFNGLSGAPWNDHVLDMCMVRPVVESASAVIVHSEMVKQMVLGICPGVPVVNIMHHSAAITEDPTGWKASCRKSLGLTSAGLIMGSFGFATSAKRILPVLDALKRFKENERTDFLYYIVGEPEKEMNLPEQVKMRGLEENVRITGFTSLEDFKTYMGACDFCLNLRYPTQGESSGSLHRMLGMGKPVIVTDVGTFGDYPDEIAMKVRYDEHEVNDIYEAICALANNKKKLQRRGKAAVEFAQRNCDIHTNALRYRTFFEQILSHTWQPEYEDVMIGRLCEFGVRDDEYIKHIWESVGLIAGV